MTDYNPLLNPSLNLPVGGVLSWIDMNMDGMVDAVLGKPDGTLAYLKNTGGTCTVGCDTAMQGRFQARFDVLTGFLDPFDYLCNDIP